MAEVSNRVGIRSQCLISSFCLLRVLTQTAVTSKMLFAKTLMKHAKIVKSEKHKSFHQNELKALEKLVRK
jgi:hypothetical protein